MIEKQNTEVDFKKVQTILFFIGYPRSGHTMVGSLLDAHEHIVLSHELDILELFENKIPTNEIFNKIHQNTTSFFTEGREWMGYNYEVKRQHQGSFSMIKVIGDKSGGLSSRRLMKDINENLISEMATVSKKQIKMVHIIRNPFDNITTMVTRTNKRNNKVIDQELLDLKIKHYYKLVDQNVKIRKQNPEIILDIHYEDFVSNPILYLKKITKFIGMIATDDYLTACAKIVWDKPSKTREKISALWTKEMIEKVTSKNKKIDFLKKYNFEN